MIVRDVELSPACCCLDCSVDGLVVVCSAFQNDSSDKYIALDEADQDDQCKLSCVYHDSQKIKRVTSCIRFACLKPYLLS